MPGFGGSLIFLVIGLRVHSKPFLPSRERHNNVWINVHFTFREPFICDFSTKGGIYGMHFPILEDIENFIWIRFGKVLFRPRHFGADMDDYTYQLIVILVARQP